MIRGLYAVLAVRDHSSGWRWGLSGGRLYVVRVRGQVGLQHLSRTHTVQGDVECSC